MNKLVEIIFLKNTLWGKENEKKKVKKGFASWLIKQQTASLINRKVIENLEKKKEQENKSKEERKQKSLELKQKIKNLTLTFKLKKDENGVIFGSVNLANILLELKKNNILLKKENFSDFKPIKILGETELQIKFCGDTTKIKVVIE